MKKTWPLVPLGEVLRRARSPHRVDAFTTYKLLTVKLHHRGVVLRSVMSGAEIATKSQQLARAGQFVVARIDARHGAIGIVPEELDGSLVSNEYWLYQMDDARVDARLFDYHCGRACFTEELQRAAEGTTNRVRLQEDKFLRITVPLPPLSEQRRLVARIQALADKVEEARELRREVVEQSRVLTFSESGRLLLSAGRIFEPRTFGSFLPHVTSGSRYWSARVAESGPRFYRAQDISADGEISNQTKVHVLPPEPPQGDSARLRAGDLMIVITGATVGRCSVFSDGLEPGYVSQHVAICRLPCGQVEPRFGLWFLRSPLGQSQLLGQRYGQGKPGLNLTNIRSISFPFPPISEQRRIVSYLDSLQAKVGSLTQLQAETQQELDALMSSILDKAFKGEL